jgi:hypothetical protein
MRTAELYAPLRAGVKKSPAGGADPPSTFPGLCGMVIRIAPGPPHRTREVTMDRLLPLYIGAAVAFVGGVVYLAIRHERAARQELRDAVRDLGFIAAGATHDLLDRVTEVYAATRPHHHAGSAKYRLGNVFVRRTGDGEVYLFDLTDTADRESSLVERQAVAVVSPRLRLPPFLVIPRLRGEGAMPAMANRALTYLAKHAGTPVEFPSHPHSGEQFIVTSPEPDATRRFLEGRLHAFAGIGYATIQAGGNLVIVSRVSRARQSARRALGEQVEQALRVSSALASNG